MQKRCLDTCENVLKQVANEIKKNIFEIFSQWKLLPPSEESIMLSSYIDRRLKGVNLKISKSIKAIMIYRYNWPFKPFQFVTIIDFDRAECLSIIVIGVTFWGQRRFFISAYLAKWNMNMSSHGSLTSFIVSIYLNSSFKPYSFWVFTFMRHDAQKIDKCHNIINTSIRTFVSSSPSLVAIRMEFVIEIPLMWLKFSFHF